MKLSRKQLAAMIDHTLLKPEATGQQIQVLCGQALEYGFASVCVNPVHVPLASRLLQGGGVKVCTVIGFPLGVTYPEIKAMEARKAIELGAEELDMVINIGSLKDRDWMKVKEDMEAVAAIGHKEGVMVKAILETCLLAPEEKIQACRLALEAKVDFVKTSTGFSGGGATVEDVALMRQTVGSALGVKASGGIRTREDAIAMVQAGANRLGTSAGVAIMEEF